MKPELKVEEFIKNEPNKWLSHNRTISDFTDGYFIVKNSIFQIKYFSPYVCLLDSVSYWHHQLAHIVDFLLLKGHSNPNIKVNIFWKFFLFS